MQAGKRWMLLAVYSLACAAVAIGATYAFIEGGMGPRHCSLLDRAQQEVVLGNLLPARRLPDGLLEIANLKTGDGKFYIRYGMSMKLAPAEGLR